MVIRNAEIIRLVIIRKYLNPFQVLTPNLGQDKWQTKSSYKFLALESLVLSTYINLIG